MSEPFLGEIRMFGFNYAPVGWAFCNGAMMQISQNSALFSILGTSFGGDGRTTFGLPNLQDAIPIGTGAGPGLTPRQLGAGTGSASVSLTTPSIPFHDHTVNGRGTAAASLTAAPDGNSLLSRAFTLSSPVRSSQMYSSVDAVDTVFTGAAIGTTGNGIAHENRQPYLVLNYCIALNGIFPPRQ